MLFLADVVELLCCSLESNTVQDQDGLWTRQAGKALGPCLGSWSEVQG